MKKILLTLICILLLGGCSFGDDFSDIYLYTTSYPIEYAAKTLYSDYSTVTSIYPNGANINYEITEKKKDKYAEGQTFIYSGIANEATLARDILNRNGKIQLIDATKGMNPADEFTNVWLDPSNYLMLCSNIKSSLIDYNTNVYIKENIEKKYKDLNQKISELDVQLYDIGKNGNYNTILATNDVFSYLTKYNINVISIDENNPTIDKAYADANKLIESKAIQYIYTLEGEELNEAQEKLITNKALVKIEINDMFTLSDEEKEASKDYITLMNEIIENYKKELYKK